MTDINPKSSLDGGSPPGNLDLLLRETNHRCSNDLQLVVSLLSLQSRRAANPEVRAALADAMERVSVLARARSVIQGSEPASLVAALRQVCEALHAQAEPRFISISFEAENEGVGLPPAHITTLALVVNELTTNAIKHAFEEGKSGSIHVTVRSDGDTVTVIVDDDGLPFPEADGNVTGLGMVLMKRMMASIGGTLVMPPPGLKLFELRVAAR